ncbi:MAG: pyrimidine 5'-nucleotidase [Alphaproteobacteria bacterium]|nr:pyrimidine 5'-nucleotidase [Alphaproteobacteria bacterium]
MSLANIRTWVFDLDNTLYPARALYDEIGDRMTSYIARKTGLDTEGALEIRERYFHQYGATVVGLMRHHGIDARDFLLDVHEADHSVLEPDPDLRALIAALPGRRIIFTNGGGGHAQRVLTSLKLDGLFETVFDIETAELTPKPQRASYERLLAHCSFAAAGALLIEDTLHNLEPAHDLGFTTALVGVVHPDPRPAYLDYWAPDVKALLRQALA